MSTASSAVGTVFSYEELEDRPGLLVFRVDGPNAARLFRNESGGHRWQQEPANDRKGRVHTSTVTVAVLPERDSAPPNLNMADIEFRPFRGQGPGGQHRNTTESAMEVTHRPTGIQATSQSLKSQHANKAAALKVLYSRLVQHVAYAAHSTDNDMRKSMLGAGMRGDKRRTIRTQDGVVTDHLLGCKTNLKDYMRGDFGPFIR